MEKHLFPLEIQIEALTQLLEKIIPQHSSNEELIDSLWNEVRKDIIECNNMFLSIEEEITDPVVVEEKKNEYANEVELKMERRKDEEQHQQTKFENVLVGIDKFNFPIDLVTSGKEDFPMPLVKHGLIQNMGK